MAGWARQGRGRQGAWRGREVYRQCWGREGTRHTGRGQYIQRGCRGEGRSGWAGGRLRRAEAAPSSVDHDAAESLDQLLEVGRHPLVARHAAQVACGEGEERRPRARQRAVRGRCLPPRRLSTQHRTAQLEQPPRGAPVMRSMCASVLVSVCTLSRSALTLFSVSTSVCSRWMSAAASAATWGGTGGERHGGCGGVCGRKQQPTATTTEAEAAAAARAPAPHLRERLHVAHQVARPQLAQQRQDLRF